MTPLERLKYRTQEADDAILLEMLESAKNIILSLRFPYGDWPETEVVDGEGNISHETYLEPRYRDLQVRIAEDMFNRIGASGQTHHSENGISRSWGAEWVSEQLLREIVPVVGGVK